MPRVLLRGIGLHYHRRRGYPVLVMVHGLATNSAFWYLRVLPLLGRHFGVVLLDLRGHGQSDMPASGYTTADMAEDLRALLCHLEIDRAHVVGHSYGGAVALHYAVLYPEHVLSLTLADARIRCLQPSQRLADWPESALWRKRLTELGVQVTDDQEIGLVLLEALAKSNQQALQPSSKLSSPFVPGAFAPFGLSRGRDRTAKQWLELLRTTTAKQDFMQVAGLTVQQIREVQQPTLAIFGQYSPCLQSCRGLQENLRDCRVAIVPRVGHFHPVVRPLVFAREVKSFIDGVSAVQ